MTTTRSASSAIRPRSCVIRTIAACVSSRAAFRTSTICAWIVTSSAVVGSSATSTLGLFAIAIAIIARWRMPPENSCGYWSTRRSAYGTPTTSSSSTVRLPAGVLAHARVVRHHRLGDLVADRQHRVQRRHRVLEDHRHVAAADLAELLLRQLQQVLALEDRLALRDPGRRRQPEDRTASRRSCRSPTRRRCRAPRPAAGRSVTSVTAWTTPSSVSNSTVRSRIERIGSGTNSPLRRIERVAQPVADEVDRRARSPRSRGPGR